MTELREKFENVKSTLEYAGFGVDGLIMNSINELEKVVSRLDELAAPKTETRVYVVNGSHHNCKHLDDERFMVLAEGLGTVFTVSGFQESFNYDNLICSDNDYIRFITVEVSE